MNLLKLLQYDKTWKQMVTALSDMNQVSRRHQLWTENLEYTPPKKKEEKRKRKEETKQKEGENPTQPYILSKHDNKMCTNLPYSIEVGDQLQSGLCSAKK